MICQNCGATNQPDTRFCRECQTQLAPDGAAIPSPEPPQHPWQAPPAPAAPLQPAYAPPPKRGLAGCGWVLIAAGIVLGIAVVIAIAAGVLLATGLVAVPGLFPTPTVPATSTPRSTNTAVPTNTVEPTLPPTKGVQPTSTMLPTATSTPKPSDVPPTATRPSPTSGGLVPQTCGMTAGTADYGPIEVGTVVVLGRHREVEGDDNWAGGMDEYVGKSTTVTKLSGVDAQGCPGVRVEIDGGQYFWRIRDLLAVGEAETPQECGMTAASVEYGPIGPGSIVILGRHREVDGDDNWAADMDQYVGRTAMVTSLEGVDPAGCPIVSVDVDDGDYYWRIRDFNLVSPFPPMCEMTEEDAVYGPLEEGSTVILGRHREVNGEDNWAASMDQYVGREATVTLLSGVDPQGCPGVRVDIDDGAYFWRVRDLSLP
jgi:hypothetical protein